MKTFFKQSIICLCMCVIPMFGYAQERMELKRAIAIVKNSYNAKSTEKALKEIGQYAESGNAEAMHILGVVYSHGRIVDGDLRVSKQWFEKASASGYLKSDYNLAMMYRRGVGVEQNFETALHYLKRSAESGEPQMVYGVGYFYYKGLGCDQSYEEAIKYFEKAAEKGHRHSAFMLGLCYRNGYGVEQDLAAAETWLNKAKALGSEAAGQELETDSPERPLQAVRLRSMSATSNDIALEEHQKVEHTVKESNSLDGEYTGTLITYDWSGKHILKESPVEVVFEQNGDGYLVKWIEDETNEVEATATLTDSALVFDKATYFKTDHFRRVNPREWNFVKATLKTANNDGVVTFNGNLQLYSPDNKEPGKPMYLTLQAKNRNASSLGEELITGNVISVYPNPFAELLNVSFAIDDEKPCLIEAYSLSGSLIYRQNLGKLAQGTHRYQIKMDVPAGNYIVKVVCGDKMHSTTIVKEN